MKEGEPDQGEQAGARSEDRRRTCRIPLEAIVHYQVEGSEFINLSSNISSDGIFIKNFAPPPVDTELRIKVKLPEERGGHRVDLLGRVVRVAGSAGQERGMGVEFISFHASSLEAIRYLVNEVYEVNHLERARAAKSDGANGGYRYTPGPDEVLRLHPTAAAGSTTGAAHWLDDPRKRLVWGALLLAGGMLLGGAAVAVLGLGAG